MDVLRRWQRDFGSESLRGCGRLIWLGVNGFGSAFAPGMETEVVTVATHAVRPCTGWSRNIERDRRNPLPVQWAQCLLRPHNCYPSDIPILWDFVKHFSFTADSNGTITRYYSESAFEKDDAIVISVTAAESQGRAALISRRTFRLNDNACTLRAQVTALNKKDSHTF